MRRLLSASLIAMAVTACDSEGIDRTENPDNQTVIIVQPSADTDGSNSVADDDSDGSGSSANNTQIGGDAGSGNSSGSSNPPVSNDNTVNPFGGSGSSNGPTDPPVSNDNSVNPFGGSGSSNGPTEPVSSDDDTDSSSGGSGSDEGSGNSGAPFSTSEPSSGTTFVSTMSPLQSEAGPLCLRPLLDANGNVITNASGCPQLSYHGQLKFGDFMLATNAWNFCASSLPSWEQCVSVNDSGGSIKPRWDYDWGNESDVNGAVWLVKSYPEIIYGVKSPGEYSGPSLASVPDSTGLPAKVSELPYYKIDYSFSGEEFPTRGKPFNGGVIHGERNVAIESFFHELDSSCTPGSLIRNGSTSNQRFEIMVWLQSGAERLPAGPNDYVTTITLDGKVYDVYTKPSDVEYVAFVAKNSTTSGSINWTTFIDWSREFSHRVNEVFGRGSNTVKIQDDWCLANILLGTEIWWGEGYFQADDWTIYRTER